MNLYRKYRPGEFNEMMGNSTELESLYNKLSSDERPHTYLLSGPSGCGKTTAARIAADILGASELSVREINTADTRGIDTAREIISQMQFAPADGAPRVYIIDEVHMATKDWQNAMLKPLEDTPDHVYFFLCTTDPQKLIKTIKTRCTPFRLSALKQKELFKLVRRVSKKEGMELSKEILNDIADASDGSARVALVLLEKIDGVQDEEAISRILEKGADEGDAGTIDLCRAMIAKNTSWAEITKKIKELEEADVEKIRWAVLGYMSSILLSGKANPGAAAALDSFSEPFYSSGKAGLVLACYDAYHAE